MGNKLRISIGVPLALIIIAAGATAWRRPGTIRIALYDSEESRVIEAALYEWSQRGFPEGAKCPYSVEIVPLGYKDLLNAARAGADGQIDVFMIDDPWLAELAERSVLAETPGDRPELQDAFAPEFLRVSMYRRNASEPARRPHMDKLLECPPPYMAGGKPCRAWNQKYGLYALPVLGNVQMLVLGSDADQDAGDPVSWESVRKFLQGDPKSSGRRRYYSRLYSDNSALVDFLPFLWAYGGCIMATGGDSVGFTADENGPAYKALKMSVEMAQYSPVQYVRFQDDDVNNQLQRNSAAIGISWLAFRGQLLMTPGGKPAFHELPFATAEQAKSHIRPAAYGACGAIPSNAGALGAWLLAVNRNSPRQRQAWELVIGLLQMLADARIEWHDNTPSKRRLLYATPFERSLDELAKRVVRASLPRLAHPKWEQIESALGFRIRQAHWRGRSSGPDAIKEALTRAREEIEGILSDGRPKRLAAGAALMAGN
jgi:ABC-type glycerol-3-phosphate transport system substrate-binding protein